MSKDVVTIKEMMRRLREFASDVRMIDADFEIGNFWLKAALLSAANTIENLRDQIRDQMSERTLGQIAYEAFREDEKGFPWPWDRSISREHWEAAANAVIEECAKVAGDASWRASPEAVAAKIRTLKSQNAEIEQAPEASPRS